MKKILYILTSSTLLVGTVSNVVACNIGDFSTREYLESFSDFDWSSNQTSDGDGYNWKFNDFSNGLSNQNLEKEEVQSSQGPVDKIFNYDKYSTSYKGINFIQKQATTGSPVIKSYRPNGNKWLDFGLDSNSRKFNYINSIIDWNNGTDMDLDYNVAREKLRGRNFVAKKTVDSQQKQTFFNFFHDPSNSSSSIVGTKNPFGGNLTNLSYTHEMYTWPAITNKGWLTTSFADYTEYMHKNGVPVLGLWYMSGWEDLTRESLKSILEKDSSGYYKIVDILIEQCIKYNFDGWMINNEANGSQGDGYVIKNSEINLIMKQFNQKAEDLKESLGKKLNIIYYTNDASLEYDTTFLKPVSKKTFEAAKTASAIQLDFSTKVPNLDYYIDQEHGGNNEKRKDLYTLLNESITIPGLGAFEYKNMIFNKIQNETYSSDANNSFSIFGSGGANEFAKSFKNWANSKSLINKENEYKYLLMQQEISNLYSTYQMSGKNGYLENNSKGFDRMISQGQKDINEIYQKDPRIKFDDFNVSTVNLPELFELGTNGKYNYSTGIGNSFLEKTVIADTIIDNDYSYYNSQMPKEIENDPSMQTYFSTGSGIKFINRDQSGNILYDGITPWTNSRLADVSPTYQWDFWSESSSEKTTEISTNDGAKNVSKITEDGQLTPYYDYYNPFMKGNSISIGMGYDFNNEGEVIPGKWENNKNYYWNVMGTNLSKKDYKVDFIVKASNEYDINSNVKIAYTNSENNSTPKTLETSYTEIKDGWYKISADLNTANNISSENRIAKLGLEINSSNNSEFLFSLGGFSISKNGENKVVNEESKVSKISNEYIVKRNSKENNVNIRFNWETNNELADYYNLYYSNDNVNWYRLGQTTINKYYLRELSENIDNFIYIGVQPMYEDGNYGKIYYSKIDTKFNY